MRLGSWHPPEWVVDIAGCRLVRVTGHEGFPVMRLSGTPRSRLGYAASVLGLAVATLGLVAAEVQAEVTTWQA